MPYIIHTGHGISYGARISYIADIELDFTGMLRIFRLQVMTHIVLFFLITAEYTDLTYISSQKMLKNG